MKMRILYTLRYQDTDDVMLESVRFEFGFDLIQSDILVLQIKSGEKRLVVLNPPLQEDYNVEARFSGGEERSFCANRSYPNGQQPCGYLKRVTWQGSILTCAILMFSVASFLTALLWSRSIRSGRSSFLRCIGFRVVGGKQDSFSSNGR